MNHKTRWTVVAVVATAAVASGVGIAVASSGGSDGVLSGATRERAVQAALDHTGGGTAVQAENGDAGNAYEVEVRLDNGQVVDVSLDTNFNVTGQEQDDDGSSGTDTGGDG